MTPPAVTDSKWVLLGSTYHALPVEVGVSAATLCGAYVSRPHKRTYGYNLDRALRGPQLCPRCSALLEP